MFYNFAMQTKFDLGTFLNKTHPSRLKNYSREDFLDDLFRLFIEDNAILDKNGSPYIFGRELASRLFSNRVDLPKTIQKRINQKTFFNEKYVEKAKEAFNKALGETNIFSACNDLFSIIKEDNSFEKRYIDKIGSLISEEKYYSSLWFMLCLASLSSNRRGMSPSRQQGRPRKIRMRESFFYLSQKEKEERAEYFIGFLKNSNNHLKMEHLRELLEILAYCPVKIVEKDKRTICFNFLKNWTSNQGISDRESFIESFDDSRRTFVDRKQNFDGWEKPINEAYAELMIGRMKKAFANANETKDYSQPSKLFYDYFFVDSFFTSNEFFLKAFQKNNYFLPNYNEHINQSLWTYCHNVASFLKKTTLQRSLIDYIADNKDRNADNPTVADRCNALIEKASK